MDISDTLAPNSDQLDAVDLLGGPQTFTITKVSRNNGEQPINVHLAEFPRVWRPGKSMRRVLAACWGKDASVWAGRKVRLYCDESVRFGSEVVGGTRISHLSHIDSPRAVPLIVKRGKSQTFTVNPLTTADIVADLRAEWKSATAERKTAIEAEVARLTQAPTGEVEGSAPSPDGTTPTRPGDTTAPTVPAPSEDTPDPFDGQDPWLIEGSEQ